MDFFVTELELGNGWELAVEVEVLEYEPAYEGRYWGHPDNREPGHGAFIALGKDSPWHSVVDRGPILVKPLSDTQQQVDLPRVQLAVRARIQGQQQATVAGH